MRNKNYRNHQTHLHQQKQLDLFNTFYNYNGKGNKITPKMMGKFKTLSFNDCGKPNCKFCRSARRNPLSSKSERLTIQERKILLDLKEFHQLGNIVHEK